MLLQELMDERFIIMDLAGRTKDKAIEELAEIFVKNNTIEDKDEFVTLVKKREEIESTGIGEGIAIPHARSNSVKELRVAFGRSKKGVDFKALDRRPVYLIFMIAAPTELRKPYLQAVAKVARFLKSKVLKEAIIKASSPEEVMDLVRDFDGVIPEAFRVKIKEGRVIYKK
ncbi:MAG: PTS sugar transporter subunit IIA [Candidatus Stahlbacteria bacterium]|nr:PTS sugar transporter subunit IIA [Candidatus Stahlbacteria bacterium]